MVPLAVGTQTSGSTIRPAAYNGCFGYRPTWGDFRMTGVMEAAGSFDTLGLVARSVDDIALYRHVLLGGTTSAQAVSGCQPPVWAFAGRSFGMKPITPPRAPLSLVRKSWPKAVQP